MGGVTCQTSDDRQERRTVPPFDVKVVSDGGPEALVRVQGEADLASADELVEVLSRIPDGADVIVDLGGSTFVGTAGMRVIIEFALAHGDRWLSIQDPPLSAVRMIEILDLEAMAPIRRSAGV
jgi:hypothetical protein